MKTFTSVPASPDAYEVGEGPVWDAERQRVLWVDVNAGHAYAGSLDRDGVRPDERIELHESLGAIACSAAGDLVIAGRRRVYYQDRGGVRRPGVQVIPDDKPSRFNDAGCDPAGRFLVGTLSTNGTTGSDLLVRIEDDVATTIDDDLTLSNGLAWSPDGRVMYSIDTRPGVVWSRSYGPDGVVGPRSEFLRITEGGLPDGLCVDAAGNLWIAVWGAGQVRCYSPSGAWIATVDVAAPNTSSVAFIGRDLETLLITTAFEGMTTEQRDRYPDSGRLFAVDVGVLGLPVPPWSGR